jgi:hypothetical protein
MGPAPRHERIQHPIGDVLAELADEIVEVDGEYTAGAAIKVERQELVRRLSGHFLPYANRLYC